MKHIPLPIELASKTGFTDLIEITFADLTAAAATQTISLMTMDVGDVIVNVATKLLAGFDFSDATLISLLTEIGDGNDTDHYQVSTQIGADGSLVKFKAGTGVQLAYTTADTLDLLLTGTSGKLLNTATVGTLHIFIQRVRLNGIGLPVA